MLIKAHCWYYTNNFAGTWQCECVILTAAGNKKQILHGLCDQIICSASLFYLNFIKDIWNVGIYFYAYLLYFRTLQLAKVACFVWIFIIINVIKEVFIYRYLYYDVCFINGCYVTVIIHSWNGYCFMVVELEKKS